MSVLVPVGLVPIASGASWVTYGDPAGDPDGVTAHRTLTVRRWSTVTGHAPSAESLALLALHDAPLSDDWTGPAVATTVDGAAALVRPFREHDGIIGTVTTCRLVDTTVTVRATWHPDDGDAAALLHRSVTEARLLHVDDLMVDRASLYHPLLGVSLALPIGWDIATAVDDQLTLVNGPTQLTLSRTAPDALAVTLDTVRTTPPLTLTVSADDVENPAHLRAVAVGPDPVSVDVTGVDPATRADTLAIITSLRTHPR
jgi:hypothetical protein